VVVMGRDTDTELRNLDSVGALKLQGGCKICQLKP
jgi:hypothetical protein